MKQISPFKFKLKITLAIVSLVSGMNMSFAQDVLIAAGGSMSQGGFLVSYSVGQTTQETIEDNDNTVFQGIQFYQSTNTLKVIDFESNLEVSIYPNPTSSILNLKTNQNNELSYNLFNLLGELLISGKNSGNIVKINIDYLPNAIYLLKVTNDSSNIIKTFKIIKN